MNWNAIRWQAIMLAVVTSLVSVVGQSEPLAEVMPEQQGKLTVMQINFIDRFESETQMEYELHKKISQWSVCDLRAHYKKHKSYVDRWEHEMLPPSSEYPRRPIWSDMWKSGEDFAKSAYAMKKEGARLSCDLSLESDVILEIWELVQNHTLKITTDPRDSVRALTRQFMVSAMKVEMRCFHKYRDTAGMLEEMGKRLEEAKRIFGIEPMEVIP